MKIDQKTNQLNLSQMIKIHWMNMIYLIKDLNRLIKNMIQNVWSVWLDKMDKTLPKYMLTSDLKPK